MRANGSHVGSRTGEAWRARWVAWVCTLAAAGSIVWATELVTVRTSTLDGQVLVSLEIPGAFTDEVRSAIQSGLQTTFEYVVRLRREHAYWPDSTLGKATLEATVRYDGLVDRYNVARLIDGRVEETAIADDEDAVRAMLTRFDRVPLFTTDRLEPNTDYRVHVQVERRPRHNWFVWPFAKAWASGVAHFTFLP